MNSDINEIVQRRKRRKAGPEILRRRVFLLFSILVAVFLAAWFIHEGYNCFVAQPAQLREVNRENEKLNARKEALVKQNEKGKTTAGKKELFSNNGWVEPNVVMIVLDDAAGMKKTAQPSSEAR